MRIIDTHSHLNFPDYDRDREEVIGRTIRADLGIINVGCDLESSRLAAELAEKNPSGVFAAVGLHPNSVTKERFDPESYRQLAVRTPRVVAIGETGLDYYRIPQDRDAEQARQSQRRTFLSHLELAEGLGKPVILHVRNAHDDVLKILENWAKNHKFFGGVIHSFSGDVAQARQYVELGLKIAFNGIITFSRDYDEVVKKISLSRILIETDCPYLSPVPYRGGRNEPLYVWEVVKKIAEIKGISADEAAVATTENARKLFNF